MHEKPLLLVVGGGSQDGWFGSVSARNGETVGHFIGAGVNNAASSGCGIGGSNRQRSIAGNRRSDIVGDRTGGNTVSAGINRSRPRRSHEGKIIVGSAISDGDRFREGQNELINCAVSGVVIAEERRVGRVGTSRGSPGH